MLSRVPLGEVCDFIRGVAFDGNEAIDLPKEGYVPILRAGNIGDELDIREDLVWVPEKRVSKEQLFQIGDIAICMASGSPAVLGKTAQLKENFFGSVGAFCGIIRPTKADAGYISYWLKSPEFMAWRDSQANGVNIQNLRPNEIREIEIPLPPLDEQKRIASLLARADRLRQLRRHARRLADSLLQSLFVEMFGEPISNSKHWEQATIKELGKVVTGSTPPSEIEGMFGGSIPFITPSDLTVNTLKSQRYVTEEGAKKSRVVRAGSTLVCCIGATIGKTDIAKTKCAFNQQINAIEWNENIQDDFGFILMTFFSRIVAERGISTTLPILKKSEFEEIVIPVPPLPLQEEFARAAARVESLRRRMSESERQAEGLFESLLAESFAEAPAEAFA